MKTLEQEIDLIITKNIYCSIEGNWQVNRMKCRDEILELIKQAKIEGIQEGINRLAEICEIDITEDIEQALAEIEKEPSK